MERTFCGNKMHRHGVEQFVGKMHAAKRIEFVERFAPFDFAGKRCECGGLTSLQNRKRFDDLVAKSPKKFRRPSLRGLEHITRKITVVRALFYDREIFGATEP